MKLAERVAVETGAAGPAWSRARLALAVPVALAVALLLLKAPAAISFAHAILTYPFQVDDSEGVILSEAQWLARGVDPYQPARPDFFTAAPYTPLYTALNAAVFAVAPFTWKVGRGIALLATLGLGAGVGALLARRTGSRALGLWGAVAFLTLNLVSVWSVRARPDHLALLFNLGGLALIWPRPARSAERGARNDEGHPPGVGSNTDSIVPCSAFRAPRSALAWAAVLFALGFYTKQTLLAAPVAAGLYLLLSRPRLGLAFAAVYGALVLVPFVALDLLTRHGFYQHIVAFHSSWSLAHYLELWWPFVARYWPLLAAAALLPAMVAYRAARTREAPDLLAALYLVLAAVAAMGAGTHGGNHNHFVELLLASVLCTGLAAGRLAGTGGVCPPRPRAAGPLLAGALILLVSLGLLAEGRLDSPNWLARDFRRPLPAEREGWAQIAAFVTNDPGPVYSDNVGLLLVAGKEVRYTDPFSLSYAAATGQWDQRELVARVERGEFSLIALRYDVFATSGAATDLTPELFEAIRGRYRVIERNVLYLYAPR